MEYFSQQLLAWFAVHGRHDLPWQVADPYQVWVSEIMLQQTQVKTVLAYFPRFIARFPTVQHLAQAAWEDVVPYWAGLGYYARARNLHRAAQTVAQMGDFPQDLDGWTALSGVGRSTAGAILSFGFGQFGVILDGNVKRVLARHFAIKGDLSKTQAQQQLWQLAEKLTPKQKHNQYNQAIMDLGATVCTPKKPLCLYCPLQAQCQALAQNKVMDYPEKQSKKTVPSKTARVLIIQHQQQWLWLKRPPQGLWGGLYCLPIIQNDEDFPDFFHAADIHAQRPILQIRHQFTHFTWQLDCYYISCNARQFSQWLNYYNAQPFRIDDILSAGIPTAMKKIIRQYQKLPATATPR